MAYQVEIAPQAIADIDLIVATIRQKAPKAAREWFDGLEAAIATLADMPARCPLAPENSYFRVEIRQLLYGRYRILFTIASPDEVWIVHVRHAARQVLNP
jgi:plasmid stabilization system protein ParE